MTTGVIGSQVEHVQFIYAGGSHGGNAFALRVAASDGSTAAMKYYAFDHLGSVTAISDELGHVVGAAQGGANATVMSYDPWGARRDPDGQPASVAYNLQVGRREFTGHETIAGVGLINMNGRVYDPVLGRFLSPDPNIQAAADLQSYNRYSYVLNNPLRYTDPTGFFWKELGNYFKNPMNDFQLLMSIGVCVGTGGAGCLAVSLQLALFNATLAIMAGAPIDQTIMLTGVGMWVGAATAGVMAPYGGMGLWSSMISGGVSAALSATLSNAMNGRSLGDNVFESAALGATMAGINYGLQQGAAGLVSLASVAMSSGSDDPRIDGTVVRGRRVAGDGPDGGATLSGTDASVDVPAYGAAGSDDDQVCTDLRELIIKRVNEMTKRMVDLREDKNKLPPTGKQSIKGHRDQFDGKATNLRGMLDQYNARGCREKLPELTWMLATMEAPLPDRGPLVSRSSGLLPQPPPAPVVGGVALFMAVMAYAAAVLVF